MLAMQMQGVCGRIYFYQGLIPKCCSTLQLIFTGRDYLLRLCILSPATDRRRIILFEF
jgi:hypothetical protein